MRTVSHSVARAALVAVDQLFDVVVAEDVLPHVLHRWGPVPGVSETRDLTGPWDVPGSSRTVVLTDGNTAREQVLEWERPRRFRYRVDNVSGPFGRLFDHAVGAWTFDGDGSRSLFHWSYTFHLAERARALVMHAVAATAWARYMEQCADLCVSRAIAFSEPRSR